MRWSELKLQNLKEMVMDGFSTKDLALAFCVDRKVITSAYRYYFGETIETTRYKNKIEVMK